MSLDLILFLVLALVAFATALGLLLSRDAGDAGLVGVVVGVGVAGLGV
jgi:hypothetical protein